jgi:acetyl esterase/lipase
MPYALDPELVPVMAALAAQAADAVPVRRGDWKALRETGNKGQAALAALVPPASGVSITSYTATAKDGTPIELRWYTAEGTDPGPAVVYAHGGGMVLGSLDTEASRWPGRSCSTRCWMTGTRSPTRPGSSS